MKKKITLSLCLAIAPTLITLLSSLTSSFIPSSPHSFIPSSLIAQIPADGLVAWYPFNGNANDESGNGNNGTVNGATLTADRFGNVNEAFSFNGINNSIVCSQSGPMGNPSITLSLWLKTTSTTHGHLVSYGNDGLTGKDFRFMINGNCPNSIAFDTYDNQRGLVANFSSNWEHYVLTYNGAIGSNTTISSIYKNGILLDNVCLQVDLGTTNISNLLPLTFGKYHGTVQTGFYQGLLDDIGMYNRVLSITEIQQLYQDQTGQVQQPLTCNITAPVTTICEGESVTLSVNTTAGSGSSSQLPANLQQGLVAYYPFNGNANDESGNGNNGTVNGATLTADRFGNENGAYSFDGLDNYIDAGNSSVFNLDNISINLWYYELSIASQGSAHTMISKSTSMAGQIGYRIETSPDGLNYYVLSRIGIIQPGAGYIAGTNSTLNLWTHIVITKEAGNVIMYKNGQIVGSNSSLYAQVINNSNLLIGAVTTGSSISAYFDGKLDDVAIWSRSLSPSEIQQLYSSQSFAWNTGATTNSITVTPTTNTNYSCTVTQGNSTCTASVDINVNPSLSNDISASIVEGDSYNLGTQTLTTAGTYTEVFTSAEGCDSTVTLTLAVEPLLTCNITAPVTTICEGESVTLSVNTTAGSGLSSQLPANLQQGLVAYYPFNGNANDESGNGNNGTVNGVVMVNDRFGGSNSAFSFNGFSSFISVPGIAVQSNFNRATSFWFNTESNLGGMFISTGSGTNQNGGTYNIRIVDEGYLSFMGGNFTSCCYDINPTSGTYIKDGLWHHALVNYESGSFYFYVDGILINTVALAINTNGQFNYFGKSNDANLLNASFYNGILDDVFIYNRALSPAEIQQLYSSQSFAWNTDETSNTITVTPTTNTNYSCTVIQGNSTCTASVDITVNSALSNDISASIVEGQSYTLGTQTLTTAGTYTEVFTSSTGCDSTVTLTLSVEPLLTCNITTPVTSICAGESVTLSVNTTGSAGSSSQLPANLQQGLVGYFPFDSDYNANFNPNLFFENEFPSNPVLIQNQSLFFDGNSSLVSNSALIFSDAYSFVFKLKTSQTDINDWPWGTYLFCRDVSGISNDWSVGLGQGGKIQFNIGANSDNYLTSYIDVNDDVWHTIGCIKESNGNYYIVIDGQIQSPVYTVSNLLTNSNVPVKLGNAAVSSNGHTKFIGQLDELFLFDLSLSITEIQQLFTAQTFAWNTGATTNSIIVSPTTNSTYNCTVTQGNQTCTDSITITVNPLLDWYADADGDGFGNPNAVVLDCNQPAGYVTDNTDCNDAAGSAFPGGEEICDNNIDEDCNGQDSICFVTVLGCTNTNACNFNPLANTDDNSCILPQPEICDGLDNNCNNQVDEGFTIPTINPVAVTPALYPVCTGNALKSADFNAGTNSPIIDGNGPDLWYSFTAQFNTLRVGLSAAFGDNSIGLYTLNNGCLDLITEEHEVYTASTLATGNQILLSDQLTVGQTYYVAVHQIAGPTNASAKVCFTYLNGSACDHYYSNNTGVYTSVCNSFKAQYRANATNYIFNVLSGTQNGVNMNLTPWSYTNNNANSVVARLGSILPANHSGVSRVYTLAVPVVYGLTDAAGNVSNLLANATTTCTVTLNSEATIALRQADRCPATKSITATIASDRTVCGAMRYDWEFTEVLPNPGAAQVVQGGAYASVFFLSNVPGVAAGKTYNVRVRPIHTSGNAGNWGAVNCLRIGNAGMVLDNHPVQTAQALVRTPLLSLRAGGEMNASYSIYPNPTATGSFVLQYNGTRRGESIFAQETTMESTQELKMMDISGKVVYQQQVVLNGNAVEVQFGDLASGVYVVMVGEERMRLIIK